MVERPEGEPVAITLAVVAEKMRFDGEMPVPVKVDICTAILTK